MDDLVKACQFGDAALVTQILFDRLFPATSVDIDGCSLLHWASINAKLDVVSTLLDHGADIHVSGGVLNESVLMWGIRSGSIKVVNLLLTRGADLHFNSTDGTDALQLSCRQGISKYHHAFRQIQCGQYIYTCC